MVDWNKPIQTRDGRKAELLKRICRTGYYNVVLVTNSDSDARQWVGMFNDDGIEEGQIVRIINVPETAERWVNVYDHEVHGGIYIGNIKDTRYETEVDRPPGFIGLVKLTIVDGKVESADVVKDNG